MPQLDWPAIIHDLGLGHPLKFLWEEKAQHLTGYPNFWKQFYRKFPQYREAAVTAREFAPGERVEVDYAGDPIEWIELQTGEIHKAGAVSLMGVVLWYSRISVTGDPHGATFLQASPLSTRRDPPRRLAQLRFTLSFRDVEELLAQRGISVSYETLRCWTIKFGPQIAAKLRHRRAAASPRWHLDEMVCNINGERAYLWRAVDDEGEVLDLVVQKRRDTCAALTLLKRLLRNQHVEPESIVTDGLASYGCALKLLRLQDCHRPGRLREQPR